ncbi:hypothetical protein D3C73_737850 [compost metagenome]
MRVVPLKSLAPVRRRTPPPVWVRLPVPVIAPAKLVSSERLKISEALFSTSPVRLPMVPPLPT